MIEPFLSAVPVLKKLEDAGFEAYFVGGSVRDYLLERRISDVDIATSATPDEVKEIFTKTVDIGIEHGTVLVIYRNRSYEVTTFRTEAEYKDFRRPKEVFFIRSLNEDLMRRDFTMNAIAMDNSGQIIDPFAGQTAIKEKIIRTVGNATDRFQEDALRMMRAVRFVSQLSFDMEENTKKALIELVPLLENIAIERKRVEFEKLLLGSNRKKAIRIMLETSLYAYLPSLKNNKDSLEEMLSYELQDLAIHEMWSLLVFCLKYKGKQMETFLRNWRLPLKEIREIQLILFYLHKRLEQEWTVYDLYTSGSTIILSVEKLYHVLKGNKENETIQKWLNLYEGLPIKNRSEIDVNGVELMAWFNQKGGPWLKETLSTIEQAILDRKIVNDKRKIKEWLMECNQN
jgi:tRNA nucleotidyltransferase (CCA-adding enzyme)